MDAQLVLKRVVVHEVSTLPEPRQLPQYWEFTEYLHTHASKGQEEKTTYLLWTRNFSFLILVYFIISVFSSLDPPSNL